MLKKAPRFSSEPVSSTGSAHVRFSVPFYLVAMFFVVFDLEAVFLFLWAVAARETGWAGYWEAVVFIAVLLAGLVYLLLRRGWRLKAYEDKLDAIVCYSVLHYVFAEQPLYEFLDRSLGLLAEGGQFLLGDVPNVSKRKRFFRSANGVRCHQAYTGTEELPAVEFNVPEPGKPCRPLLW